VTGSSAAPLNAGSSTAPLTAGSSTAPLITAGSSTAPLITAGSSTAPLTAGSSTAPLITTGSATAPLTTGSSSGTASVHYLRGDFVVIKLGCGNRVAHYIGTILQQVDDGWQIQSMRRMSTTLSRFAFPLVEDVAVYPDKDIVTLLKSPKLVRSIHHFDENELCSFPNLR
jgi:hypothetical protein